MISCHCVHSFEEHGHDDLYPGSTACTECDCLIYEEDPNLDNDEEF